MLKKTLVLIIMFSVMLVGCEQTSLPEENEFDWRTEWAVASGFSITIDSRGFNLPTAIAFLPNPGSGPKDPLYMVAELGGKVKVVTNDRSVFTYAKDFIPIFSNPDVRKIQDQFGVVGICLAPEQGYVFVTYAYRDEDGAIHNGIHLFEDAAGTYSLQPRSQRQIARFLDGYLISVNHQIGNCRVSLDQLYVGVGDGTFSAVSQKLDSPLGKILRFSLDGEPSPDNPFYQSTEANNQVTNAIWAYGFRNPFGLEIVAERVFVAENGLDTDRFLEAKVGENYLWDGSGWSIGARAAFVMSPAIAPTSLEFYPPKLEIFPQEYRDTFFMGLSGLVSEVSQGTFGRVEGIMSIPYDFSLGEVLAPPEYFLHYRGNQIQSIVGIAFGADGLYFAPLLPNPEGVSAIYRVSYDPENEHPIVIGRNKSSLEIINEKGCLGCHQINAVGGIVGPPLDRDALLASLSQRLNSDEYLLLLDEVDGLIEEPYVSFTAERAAVRESGGLDRVRLWIKFRLQEPRFDNPKSQMPNLGLTEEEAAILTNYLLEEPGTVERLKKSIEKIMPNPVNWWHLLYAFIGGFGVALMFLGLLKILRIDKLSILWLKKE